MFYRGVAAPRFFRFFFPPYSLLLIASTRTGWYLPSARDGIYPGIGIKIAKHFPSDICAVVTWREKEKECNKQQLRVFFSVLLVPRIPSARTPLNAFSRRQWKLLSRISLFFFSDNQHVDGVSSLCVLEGTAAAIQLQKNM